MTDRISCGVAADSARKPSFTRMLPLLTVLIIGGVYVWTGFNMPMLGDDIVFHDGYLQQKGGWLKFLKYCHSLWSWNNGRLADMLAGFGLAILPVWCNALISGASTALMMWMIPRSADSLAQRPLGLTAWMVTLSLAAFTLRWDTLWMEYITQYNYVYSAAWVLGVLWLLLYSGLTSSERWGWVMWPLGFVAGAMHEGAGLPVAAGLVIWIAFSGEWKRRSPIWRGGAVCLGAGALASFLSPGNFGRPGTLLQPDPLWEMTLLSGCYVLLLAMTLIWIGLRRGGRQLLRLLKSPLTVYAVAGISSSMLMYVSGYGGRPGWFGQIFSLVALVALWSDAWVCTAPGPGWRIARIILDTGLFLLLGIHYTAVGIYQQRLARETREVISLYRSSPDGIINYDYTPDTQLPQWLLLRKTHGVPDEDDTHYRTWFSRHYGHGHPLAILPRSFSPCPTAPEGSAQHQPLVYGHKVMSTRPIAPAYGDSLVSVYPRRMVNWHGKEYIETRVEACVPPVYMYTETDRDPGEK